ncbi:hypothetical protein P1A145kb_p065 [Pectobacterium phage DU_PP_I]|nr:hypothetical protein P1A145kb_p065 [Pectobacterium phage DU_PP_I]
MKMLMCCRVNKGFEEVFTPGKKYKIIATAQNGKAWNVERFPGDVTFVSSKHSFFGKFVEVDENE